MRREVSWAYFAVQLRSPVTPIYEFHPLLFQTIFLRKWKERDATFSCVIVTPTHTAIFHIELYTKIICRPPHIKQLQPLLQYNCVNYIITHKGQTAREGWILSNTNIDLSKWWNDSILTPRYCVLWKVCWVYNPYLSVVEIDYLSMCEDLRGNVIKRVIIDYTYEK